MCGIVGLFLKNPKLQPELGKHLEIMLVGMSERGPDSAGIAVYHSAVPAGQSKITLFNADTKYDWKKLAADLGKALGVKTEIDQKGNHARLVAHCAEERVLPWIRANHPDVRIMGYGQLTEGYKDMALPAWKAPMPSAIREWRPRARSRPSTRTPSRRPPTCAWCTTAPSPTTTI